MTPSRASWLEKRLHSEQYVIVMIPMIVFHPQRPISSHRVSLRERPPEVV